MRIVNSGLSAAQAGHFRAQVFKVSAAISCDLLICVECVVSAVNAMNHSCVVAVAYTRTLCCHTKYEVSGGAFVVCFI